ncbi:MAG: hypothetical protein GX621_01270 [Pirellulaceae bacterium]|nr:hypothetical protein [Pirellulaceae bacterium]
MRFPDKPSILGRRERQERNLRPSAHGFGVLLLTVVGLGGAMLLTGCREPRRAEDSAVVADTSSEWREHHFANAVDNLQRLEEFAGGEMRQQVVDRFNQWIQHEKMPSDWEVDSAVAELPEPLKELEVVRSLDRLSFLPFDGYALQEAVWLRDVSNWAKGEQLEDLVRAQNLFDWTVCNIQLVPGAGREPDRIPQQPWETLLWGKGTAVDRAWVLVLLLRQQGIDAVVLALPDPADPSGETLDPWAVGVLEGNELYLFDLALGLPIPGPEGAKFEDGRLLVSPATLSDVVKDPALLRNLDVTDHVYPVDAERLASVVALVEASPAYLEARMKLIESRLAGEQQVTLTTSPSAMIDRLKEVAHLADRRLWIWPYEVLARRDRLTDEQKKELRETMRPFRVGQGTPLWKGRVLHLKGVFEGMHNATHYYQAARPSTRDFAMMKRQIAEEPNLETARNMREILAARQRAKGHATYWLGLAALAASRPEDRDSEIAVDYLSMRSLLKPWEDGVSYNLGRVAESVGQPKQAATIYRTAPVTAGLHGNLVRAQLLDPAPAEVRLPDAEVEPTPAERPEPSEQPQATPTEKGEKPEKVESSSEWLPFE